MMRKIDSSIKKIILCFDNSDLSFAAADAVINIAQTFDSEVVGLHGYNAFMHEGAFRIMEPTLPAEYQKEEILEKQRKMHTTLIKAGMEKISLSYLRPLEEKFHSTNIPFRPVVREGKNFRAVKEMIAEEGDGLVVMGATGFNSNGNGFIGSVCLRVLRGADSDYLLIKKPFDFNKPKFVVGLDGSSSAISALKKAKLFADRYDAELHLVYVFDSALHKDLFERLKESVISKEGFSFNSKEQERIHDEFIDKGLARVGNMILDKAEREVFGAASLNPLLTDGWGVVGDANPASRTKRVLEGHIYKKICDYAAGVEADLVFVGRTGRHFTEGMDIGSVTENVARFSPCSVFVAKQEDYRGWEL